MKHIDISVNGMDMDYQTASIIAKSIAEQCESEPTVVAWHDAKQHRMSPVIEGADELNRWRDYGESHGGDVDISINGEFDFIFAEGANFEELGHSPYITLQDQQGNQFLCKIGDLRDPKDPSQEACFSIEQGMTPSSMHGG